MLFGSEPTKVGQLQEERKVKVNLILLAAFHTSLVIRLPHAHLREWRGYVAWKQTLYRVLTGPLAFLKTGGVILAPLVMPH